jgi:hypothetical protein
MSAVKDKILTIADVAKLKGVSLECIRTAIRNGDLKAIYFHGEWHIRESSYLEYAKKCHQDHYDQFITLQRASGILNISQAIILRAIQRGAVKTREDRQGFKISLESLLEWDRKNFARYR